MAFCFKKKKAQIIIRQTKGELQQNSKTILTYLGQLTEFKTNLNNSI
jgi:hypothetical protein